MEKLKEKDISHRTDVPAATLCTFRIGGTVALVIEPRCEGELWDAISLCRVFHVPFEILGNGSNVLFEDGYLRVAIIRTNLLDACRITTNGVYAGCGILLPQLCHLAALHGLAGLQTFCGIPGTLGGALAMNAGAYGKQISDLVRSVKILDITSQKLEADFSYKKNAFYRNCAYQGEKTIFIGAELSLDKGADPSTLLAEMKCLKAHRRSAQPLEYPNAGCVFQRPRPDLPIGRFLDELGCKGMRVGGAEVSEKHAAFIVNRGGASADDVKKLMLEIEKKAEKERGMILSREIRIISNEK